MEQQTQSYRWHEAKLGDLIEHQKGFAFKSSEYEPAGHPVVRVSNFTDRSIDVSDCKYIAPSRVAEYKAFALKKDDVLIATVGSWPSNPASVVGKAIRVPAFLDQSLLNQNAVRLRTNGGIDQAFLFHILKTQDFQDYIIGTAQGSANQASITLKAIFDFSFLLPSLDEQQEIANILGTLDDKIELNQQMNWTLEGIARALFKSWFIDFDPVRAKLDGRQPTGMDAETADLFPDSFEDSPLGEIPKGWEVKRLSEVTTKIGSGATPRGGSQVYVDEGIALIRSQNIYDYEFRWNGLAFMTEDTATKLKNVAVEPDDILLNITGDSILRTCVVDPFVLPARVNQHVAIIRAKSGIPCRYLHLHLVNPQMKNTLLGFDTGATRKAVTKGQLESVKILIPSGEVLQIFEKLTVPMFQNVQANLVESRVLASFRDALLPKLLSGGVKVGA